MRVTQSGPPITTQCGQSHESKSVNELVQSLAEILVDLDTPHARLLLSRMKRLAVSIHNTSSSSREIIELSQRENQVLVLIGNGYTRRDIAFSLGISTNTAARHIANIYSKLGISSVAEATTYALQHNLIAFEDRQ